MIEHDPTLTSTLVCQAGHPLSAEDTVCPICGTLPQVALTQPTNTPLPNIAGHEILEELGRGGMGVVYRARQISLGRTVALKMILDGVFADRETIEAFCREAEALARLQHPHFVNIHEIGDFEGKPFIVMEWVGGGNLAQKMAGQAKSRISHVEFRNWLVGLLAKMARAMNVAHQQGIVHLDLKPLNVLLTGDGTPKIGDFGLAQRIDADSFVKTGQVRGTLGYMAPEQAQGQGRRIGPAADVYALGCILYEMLTGQTPIRPQSSLADTLRCIIEVEPAPPRALQPAVPLDLETICLKCLEKDPGKRYGSAQALADDLERFQAGEPVAARPVSRLERAWRWMKRKPAVATLLVGAPTVLIAATIVASIGFMLEAEQRKTADQLVIEKGELADKNGHLAELEAEQRKKAEQLAVDKGRLAEQKGQLARDHLAARQEAERNGYLTAVALANRELQAANVPRARELIAACPAPLRGWEWHLLDRACHEGARVLGKLDCPVNGLAFSPDGKVLASANKDGTVRLWDVATGNARVLKGHTGPVRRVVFRPDGAQLASAGDKTVRIWDAATGQSVYVFDRHTGDVVDLSYHPSGNTLASAGTEGKILVWQPNRPNVKPGELTTGGAAQAVVFSPDRRWLAASSGDEVAVWNLKGGEARFRFKTNAEPGGLAFTRDGNTLVSAGQRKSVKLWDLSGKGQLAFSLHGHSSAVVGVAFPEVGDRFATAGWDRTVRVWSTVGGADQLPITLRGHTAQPRCLAYRADGDLLASADDAGAILLWQLRGRGQADLGERIGDLFADGYSVAFSPDGQRLVAAAGWHLRKIDDRHAESEGEVRIWKLAGADRDQPLVLHGHVGEILDLAFQPHGSLLATAGKDGEVRLWDGVEQSFQSVAAPTKMSAPPKTENWVEQLFLSVPALTQVSIPPKTRTLRSDKEAVNGVAFRPDGRFLVSGSNDGTVRIWNVADGKPAAVWKGHEGAVHRVAYSPDGKTVASAGADATGRLWPADGGTPLILRGHKGAVRCVAFDRQGRLLATGGDDGSVRLWDAKTGTPRGELRGHSGPVLAVCFDRDGGRLASGGGAQVVPGEVIVWDVEHRVEALKLVGHEGPVSGVAFSPDGLDLVSVGRASLGPGEVYLWSGRPRPSRN